MSRPCVANKVRTRDTEDFRRDMETGRALASALGPPLVSLAECAEELGLSKQTVYETECRALAKVAAHMRLYKNTLHDH
jgi:hypothetical protein